jgi:hypothetical protein
LWQHEIDNLKALAFAVIAGSLNQLEQSRLIAEAFTPFTSRQGPPTTGNCGPTSDVHYTDTQNCAIFTFGDCEHFQPMDPMELFDNNCSAIFLETFHTAEIFSHHCYKPSWMDPLLMA